MKIIPYEINNGLKNMQIDSDLLENAIESKASEPVLRLYGWKPKCISLGRNQKNEFLNEEAVKKYKIDVVKRLTGGRALLHDNELTYSFVCSVSSLKNGDSVIGSYKEIAQIFIEKFKQIGINLEICEKTHSNSNINYCMLLSTNADLCVNGKKLIGSAQFRKKGYILQHGSILIDYNKDLLEELFNEEVKTGSITSIKEINPTIKIEDIINLWSNNNDF